jgi:Ulp1 family protease
MSYSDFHPALTGRLDRYDMADLTQNEYLSPTVVNTMVHLLNPQKENALISAPRVYLDASFLNNFDQLFVESERRVASPQQLDPVNCGVYAIENVLGLLRGVYPNPEVQVSAPAKRQEYIGLLEAVKES